MRVVLNQSTALGARTGIGYYTLQLLRCLRELAPADRFDAFPPSWWGRLVRLGTRLRSAPGSTAQAGSVRPEGPTWRDGLATRLRHLERATLATLFRASARLKGYDLYHEPNYIPLACPVPTVATLPDLSVLLHPEWHPKDRVAYYERYFHKGLKEIQHFFTISEFTRQEVLSILHIAPERVTRTYLGTRPGLAPLPPEQTAQALRQLGLKPGYLLSVGTIEPRKNLLLLMRAYCDLPACLRERSPLLLVGGWGWNTAPIAEYYHAEARHRGVVQLGYVGDDHMSAIYNGARALVFPSHYEGFGLPPLEMMACGGAVIASTAGSIVETVGSRAHLLPPNDLEAWRDAMKRIILDDDWRESLRQGVVDLARRFSWERCAAQTLSVYRHVCGLETASQEVPLRAA